EAREIDVVIFDKTGTLTEGRFGVVNLLAVNGWDEQRALALTAAVEGDSEHPIARGIREKAEQAGVQPAAVSDFEAIKGRGIKAQHDGRPVYVGGPRMLEMLELSLPEPLAAFAEDAGRKAQSVVYLILDDSVVAAFAIADVVRPESRQVVERLHAMGIEVAMLTGDSQQVASAVAEELGIDTVFAEVLPEHKDHKVAELQQQGSKVAMVWDGVKNATDITRADVDVAIGSCNDVSIESAGIMIVRRDPLNLVKIFGLSRAT